MISSWITWHRSHRASHLEERKLWDGKRLLVVESIQACALQSGNSLSTDSFTCNATIHPVPSNTEAEEVLWVGVTQQGQECQSEMIVAVSPGEFRVGHLPEGMQSALVDVHQLPRLENEN